MDSDQEFQEKINQVQPKGLYWEIVTTRFRKDIFRKPSTNGGVGVKWYPDVSKDEVAVVVELFAYDGNKERQIEIGFVSVKGVFSVKGAPQRNGTMVLSPLHAIYMGQMTYDTARGVFLAKAAKTPLEGLVFHEPDPKIFFPTSMPGISLN